MSPATEIPFRIALGLLWVLNLAVRLYFQSKVKGAQPAFARHARRERFFYRLVTASYLLMLVYIFSPWLDFAHLGLPAWLRWLGSGILLAGLGLFAWTHHTLGQNWSGGLEIYQEHALVTAGPYRYVRHPMYTAFFVLGSGIGLLSANWLVAILNLGSLTWMYLVRVSAEEAMLLEHFGEAYRQYMKKTGRLLPRLRESSRHSS